MNYRDSRPKLLSLGLCLAILPLADALAGSLPKFPTRTPYAEARRSLKALGYAPMVLPDADDVSRKECGFEPDSLAKIGAAPVAEDERCYPEMEACAGTGLGQCVFSWRRGDSIIEVLTVGERPTVDGVRCRVSC